MPYLAFDLDAKKRVPKVARALGMSPGDVSWGLLELWEFAWAGKTDTVSEMVIDGCFGPDPRVRLALAEYGFVERTEDGWRIKGADRYLRVSAARKKGAEATNAKRWGSDTESLEKSLNHRSSVAQASLKRRSEVALSPSTEHPTPNTSKATDSSATAADPPPLELALGDPKTDPEAEVVAHYVEAMRANGVEVRDTDSKRKLVRKRLKEHSADELKEAISGLTWSDWHMGRDPKTGGHAYTGLEYAIGDSERIEANVQRARAPPTPKKAGGWR